MRWEGREGSSNIEDRRGMRVPGGRGTGFGCIGLLVVLGISLLTGADPRQLLGLLGLVEQMVPQQAPATQSGPVGQAPADDPQAKFIGVVLKDTENTWNAVFRKSGKSYSEPTLVLFDGRVASACGMASAAVGPFYCPLDSKVYLDLAFFRELDRRFGAPGDFAQAYVVAHEVGHHVQNLLGISDQVQAAQQRARSREQANALSVLLELQADCFAGVWGRPPQPAGCSTRATSRRALRAAGRDRRRHDPAAVAGLRGARVLDARLGADARALAAAGPQLGRPGQLRHLQGGAALMQVVTPSKTWDVCIVGSGAGGGMAAKVLAEAGRRRRACSRPVRPGTRPRTARCSRGPTTRRAGAPGHRGAPVRRVRRLHRRLGHRGRAVHGRRRQPASTGSAARMLGGRTNHWGRISLRFGPWRLQAPGASTASATTGRSATTTSSRTTTSSTVWSASSAPIEGICRTSRTASSCRRRSRAATSSLIQKASRAAEDPGASPRGCRS